MKKMYLGDWLGMLLLVILIIAQPANAQPLVQETQNPAIDGYSPVSYFTQNRAEKGLPEYAVSHEGVIYYLTSQEQVDAFNENPDKYRPRHDTCPYSLALGTQLPLDPMNFKIVGDTLLLFHVPDAFDLSSEPRLSGIDEQTLTERATGKFELLRF